MNTETEKLKAQIERMKKEQAKQIKLGVERELFKVEIQITRMEDTVKDTQKRIDELLEVERELDKKYGALKIHKQAIKRIKDQLSFLTVSFADAWDTGVMPIEVFEEWKKIHDIVKRQNEQVIEFIKNKNSSVLLQGA